MMMVGEPGKSLKPSRPSSSAVSTFNLGQDFNPISYKIQLLFKNF